MPITVSIAISTRESEEREVRENSEGREVLSVFIGKRDKSGNIYYTLKDIPKIHMLTEFFKYGFYIALIIWLCGICFSTFYNGSAIIRIAVIVATLCIYIFFVVGKAVVDSKYGK